MNFDRITNKYPSERTAIGKLKQLIESDPEQRKEFSLNAICDLVQPKSREEMAFALGEMVRQGQIHQVIRVLPRNSNAGIHDFKDIHEVPSFIHDWRNDLEIEVTPENLRVIYIIEPTINAAD